MVKMQPIQPRVRVSRGNRLPTGGGDTPVYFPPGKGNDASSHLGFKDLALS
jgi:hypothetical protein